MPSWWAPRNVGVAREAVKVGSQVRTHCRLHLGRVQLLLCHHHRLIRFTATRPRIGKAKGICARRYVAKGEDSNTVHVARREPHINIGRQIVQEPLLQSLIIASPVLVAAVYLLSSVCFPTLSSRPTVPHTEKQTGEDRKACDERKQHHVATSQNKMQKSSLVCCGRFAGTMLLLLLLIVSGTDWPAGCGREGTAMSPRPAACAPAVVMRSH